MKKNFLNWMLCLSAILLVNINTQAQTLLHYWTFNSFASAYHNPGIPALKADYSRIDVNKTGLAYQLKPGTPSNYAGYVDNAAVGTADSDIYNVRTIGGVVTPVGNSYRFRNPADSAYLVFYIPSTNYKNLKFSYAVEASSPQSGIRFNNFSYSTDSGATWKTVGLDHIQDSTISIGGYTASQLVFKLITVTFTSADTTVNNNPRLAFRITPSGNTSLTSGNDRFDNVSLDGDSIIAAGTYIPSAVIPMHYWHFNSLVSPYGAATHLTTFQPIKANFSMIDTNKATIVYQEQAGTSAAYSTYYDATTGDTINARLGQVAAGTSLRLRNPSDSMELRLYAPTTAHQHIKLTFETEASSTSSGAKNQLFDYSLDSGATWHNTGMVINNVAGTKDSVTITWAKVQVAFDSTVNNNNRFVVRMKFQVADTGTSGNDRIDNVTIDGDTLIIVTPPPPPSTQALIHYWNFNNLASTYHNPGIPALKADYSVLDTNITSLQYQLVTGTSSAYAGYIDNYATTTADLDTNNRTINGVATPSGSSYRLRNPADSAYLVFYIPSINYKDLVFSYAVESSSTASGISRNNYFYSLDSGATWQTSGLSETFDSTTTVFSLKSIKITDAAAYNNPRLAFKIIPQGNTSGTSGNDRFDNVTLDGVAIDTSFHYNSHVAVPIVTSNETPMVLYPNPAGKNVYVNTFMEGEKAVAVYNVTGQKVYSASSSDRILNINTAQFITGMYYVNVRLASGEVHTLKFVKQ